jgi:hypothetical protein
MRHRIRLLQCSDLHVGRGRASWGEKRSLKRAAHLFDTLYQTAHDQKCSGMLICGDVFDQKAVTNAERELVARKLTELSADMPTYVTSGNHDLKSKTNSNLDFLAEITERTNEIPNLHVAHSNTDVLWRAPVDSLPEGLYILGVSCPLSEDQRWIESRVQEIPEMQRVVFMGHATVRGCTRNDSGWKPEDEEDKGLSLAAASTSEQVIWWAFGDIHARQPLPTLAPEANGWYAGSPIQMDFGERPDRGCLIVAFDWNARKGWHYRGRKYIRLDDQGFAPLVTVAKPEELDGLPKEALLRLAKGLVLPSERHAQVVTTLPVVEDRSTPEAALKASGEVDEQAGASQTLDAFDPLMSSLADVEKEVLAGLTDRENAVVLAEAKQLVGQAVDRYRERTFVS